MKDVVELEKASIKKVNEDVLITQFKSGAEINERDAREIDGARVTMSQGGDMFLLVDLRAEGTVVEKSAEDFFQQRGKMIPFTKAVAVVKDSRLPSFSKFLKRFMYPYKEFRTKEEAQEWFNALRN